MPCSSERISVPGHSFNKFQTFEGPTPPRPFSIGGMMHDEGFIVGVGVSIPLSLPTIWH
jgi:hypothetical protein